MNRVARTLTRPLRWAVYSSRRAARPWTPTPRELAAELATLAETTMLVVELRYPDGATGPMLSRQTLAMLAYKLESNVGEPLELLTFLGGGLDGERVVLRLESTVPQRSEPYLGKTLEADVPIWAREAGDGS